MYSGTILVESLLDVQSYCLGESIIGLKIS